MKTEVLHQKPKFLQHPQKHRAVVNSEKLIINFKNQPLKQIIKCYVYIQPAGCLIGPRPTDFKL